MHAALFGGAEFGRQGGMNGAGSRDPVDALERRTDQQHAIMGLAARLSARMAGMVGTVVLDADNHRFERGGQGGVQAISAGWNVCHSMIIGALDAVAKVRPATDLTCDHSIPA